MAKYSVTSPYYATEQNDINLDIMTPRTYTIDKVYAYRPDLLAYDLYDTPRLWWVFAQRNPDVIEDPIYDFTPGKTIQLPKLANLQDDLGV